MADKTESTYRVDIYLTAGEEEYPSGDEIAEELAHRIERRFGINAEVWHQGPGSNWFFLSATAPTIDQVVGVQFDVLAVAENKTASYVVRGLTLLYDNEDYEDFQDMVRRRGLDGARSRWASKYGSAGQAQYLAERYHKEGGKT